MEDYASTVAPNLKERSDWVELSAMINALRELYRLKFGSDYTIDGRQVAAKNKSHIDTVVKFAEFFGVDLDDGLDQPATLEWVRGREGWNQQRSDWIEYAPGQHSFYAMANGKHTLRIAIGRWCENPTRKQIIAAENFAKEMGLV